MFPKPFGQYAGGTVQFAAFCGFAVMNGVLASKELENQMFNGLKARRQLAAYVALGLSTGGGLLFSAQPAHAAETHDHTVTASSINGFEGSDQTGFMSDNRITIGTAGVTNQPFSTYGIISGGGKTDTASDVTGNTLTIHGLQVSNGNGQSMIYGGVSGTGAVTNNKVFFNNGLSKDSIYGGFNGTSATNAVTGNSVTVVDGTVEGDVQGGGTAGTGAVTGNSVTITGGTLKDEAMGGIIRSTTSSADITGNTLTISGGAFTKSGGTNVFGAYTAGSGKAENNSVTVSNLTNTDLTVYGAHAAGGGNAVNNHVTIGAAGKVKGIYGGRADSATGKAEGNTVTIETGGWVNDNSYAGWAKGAANRNIFTVKGHADWSVYGGRIDDAGDTAEGNEVRIEGGTVNGHAVGGKGGTGTTVTGNKVTVTSGTVKKDITGGQVSGANGKATGNIVTITDSTAEGFVYGGSTVDGGTASGNQINISGSTIKKAIMGGYDSTNGSVTGNTVTVSGSSTVEETIYGGYSDNTGTVTDNSVAIAGGTFQETIYGGYSDKSGTVTGNKVALTGGTFQNVIYGGAGGDPSSTETFTVNNNTVTIAGGTFSSNIYGGYSWKADGTTENNTVNLGDDAHHDLSGTTLSASNISGGNKAATGNTLNVKAKNAVVKGVRNFENVNFHINDDITDGSTMLTVNNDGLGRTVDWEKVKVLAESLISAVRPNREVTLLKSNAANELKFSNYNVRNFITDPNSDYEAVMRTDTEKGAGTVQSATAVTLRTNRWRNSEWTYDGTNPSTVNEVAGGISYDDNHTTYNNQITVTGVPSTNLNFVYGGKTNGAADSKENRVIVESTGTGSITNINGGFTGKTDGVAEGNRVTIKGGTVTNVMGGAVSGANASATKNKVFVEGGTVTQGVIGGGGSNTAAGNMSENEITITGGTVSGQIVGGYSRNTNSASNKNTVTLGGGTLTGAEVWGSAYYNASNQVQTFANNDAKITGNTLNVQAENLTVKKVRNFEKFNFKIGSVYDNAMLTLSEAGGFGGISGTHDDVKVAWSNVTADTSGLSAARGDGVQGKNTLTLLQRASSLPLADDLLFDNYTSTDTAELDRVYEKKLHTDTNSGTASKVQLELNRYKDGTVTHNGTTAPAEVYGGYTAYDHTERDADGHDVTVGTIAEGNTLHITGVKTLTNNLKAYGGYAEGAHGGAVNNHVHVDVQNTNAGSLDTAVGGYTKGTGAVHSNTLRFSQGATLHDLMGGYIDSTTSAADVSFNTVAVEGGTVGDKVYGGYTRGTGAAKHNTVVFDGAASTADDLTGGYGATASDNTVEMKNGTVHVVNGGDAVSGDALRNTVTITGGTVTDNVYGGQSRTGAASGNTVNIGAVTVGQDNTVKHVVGGFGTTNTDNNTINLAGSNIKAIVLGGAIHDSSAHQHQYTEPNPNGVGNTLAIHARGTEVRDFAGVQNLHFYIPAGTTADPAAATMLRLTKAEYLTNDKKDLSNIHVRVGLAGSRPTLNVGDTVSLMKAYKVDGGNSKAVEIANAPSVTNAEGMHGISLRYKFNLLTREAQNEANANTTNADHLKNELVAEVTDVSINDQTKSLVETRAATTAMINGGADLLTENGFRAAEEAITAQSAHANAAAGAAASLAAGNAFQMWASQGGSSTRLNSGSYVDAKGWNLNLGFAKKKTAGRNTITYGPMIEYGRGSYDSYLDDGTHGDGSMSYFGAGVMAKSKSESGAYVEGSLRVGRVKSDYSGNIDNKGITYESSSTYYGIHLGVGQEKELKGGNTLDTYAKYFYSHQASDTVKMSTGETYEFDAVDSHRIRIGARYTKKLSGGSAFYTGLAYEYEFGSEAGATFDGYSTPSPSLKGSTGLLELGYRFAPKDERVSYGVNLMGMTGKRRGISGGIQINWAF